MPATGTAAVLFGLTGATSASGVSADTLETLKAHEPVGVMIERERLRLFPPPGILILLGSQLSGERGRLLGISPGRKDEVIARIKARRRRLFRERGLFADSVDMIRELREAGR